MYFLIDYENVKNTGMQGCEVLESDDIVALFYSDNVKNMEVRYLKNIETSKCKFKIFKLEKTGKNALDFYIATHLGETFGSGFKGKTAIISQDGGFAAVRDYWTKCAEVHQQVILAPTVEQGILKSGENSERVVKLLERKKINDITAFYAGYKERRKLYETLERAFSETEYSGRTAEIQEIIAKSSSAKVLYLDTLRHFGKKAGLEVYRKLRDCVNK